MHDPDDDAFEAAFLRGLLDDAESKTAVDVESWVARFPNREAVIRRAWSSATSGETDDARSDERRVGRYEILELLGSGGQGDVYRALDTDLGRHVALKRLSRLGSLSPTRLARFRREAETASRIDHPGLCPVYETGIDEGVPFIVMRHIQGESLARRLVRRRGGDDATIAPSSATEVDELVAIFEKIARSLHAAHEGGILHRDVKPGNIMVGDDGEPVLLDFGLARPTDDVGEALTETGDFLGTPAYMSPEQLGGAGSRLDRRTDVYSLAATLYECLTLRRPFDVPTRDALFHAILHESPIDPRRLNPGVGKDLAVVLRVALEKDVDRRYDTAAAFADDLHRVAARRPIAARPPRPWTRLLRWAQRNPVLAVTATALLAALIAGTAISLYFAAEAAARLGDWERLADRRRLEDLVQEANTVLWPATPEKVPAIAGWLARARPVAARLPSHREALERLRAAARPYDADAAARNRALFFFEEAEELEALTAEIDAARRKLEEFEESDHSRRDRVEETLDDLENRRADLRDRVAERRLWELDTPEDQLRHDALADLVRKLAEFSGAPAPGRVTIGGLTERLADASSLIARTIDAHALEWRRVRERIAASARYAGLDLPGQPGLVPLGSDRESGLEEFAETRTGEPPRRDDQGRLILSETTGLVFVLLPRGSVTPSGSGPASPLIRLDPFFVSKCEMTQGQWLRATGETPSFWAPGMIARAKTITLRHPVDSISWTECHEVLRRLGLRLPSDAQWEYACRAGTATAFSTGEPATSLRGHANIADEGSAPWYPGGWSYEAAFDDGYGAHAPVASFGANGFGLHDMHGNVMEWCEDGYGEGAGSSLRAGDGLRPTRRAATRVRRGGSFHFLALFARSDHRSLTPPASRATDVGCRPVRSVQSR